MSERMLRLPGRSGPKRLDNGHCGAALTAPSHVSWPPLLFLTPGWGGVFPLSSDLLGKFICSTLYTCVPPFHAAANYLSLVQSRLMLMGRVGPKYPLGPPESIHAPGNLFFIGRIDRKNPLAASEGIRGHPLFGPHDLFLMGQIESRASVCSLRGHPGASVFRERVKTWELRGIRFSENGHPLTRNSIFGGHQASAFGCFKILKGGNDNAHTFWSHTPKSRPGLPRVL